MPFMKNEKLLEKKNLENLIQEIKDGIIKGHKHNCAI